MSFGGVDEAKLVAEAKAQLLPEVERILAAKLGDLEQRVRSILQDYTITVTITPKPKS